jgi:hypothetical protein
MGRVKVAHYRFPASLDNGNFFLDQGTSFSEPVQEQRPGVFRPGRALGMGESVTLTASALTVAVALRPDTFILSLLRPKGKS